MRLKSGILVQKLGDKYVLYDNETSILHEFNQVGHFILERLDMGMENIDICRELTQAFEVSEEQANVDLDEFLVQLKDKNLLI